MANEQLPRRSRESLRRRAIREILRATSATLSLDDALPIIANIAIIAFDAGTSWLMLAEEERLRTVVARGDLARGLAGTVCDISAGGRCATAARGNTPVILAPTEIDSGDPVVGLFAQRRESVILLPLKKSDRVLGLLGCTIARSTSPDLMFLVTIADQISMAIQAALLRAETRTWRERADAILECMAEAVAVFDHEGKLVRMNATAAALLDPYPVQLRDSIADLLTKAGLGGESDRFSQYLEGNPAARALRGERVESMEEQIQTRDGPRYYLISAVPLVTECRVDGAVVVWRDITERKRAETERDRLMEQLQRINEQRVGVTLRAQEHAEVAERRASELATVFAAVAETLVIYDVQGTPVRANPAAVAAYGFDPVGVDPEVLAQKISIRYPDGRSVMPADLPSSRVLRGETVTGERFLFRNAEGHERVILVSAAPLRSHAQLWGAVVIWHDVTEREHLLTEVEQARERMEEMIHIIAHDARQPLTALRGNAQLLSRFAERSEPQRIKKQAETIDLGTRRLESLIHDLTDSIQLESGQLQLNREPIELGQFVREALVRLSVTMEVSQVQVQTDQPLVAYADPDRLERILGNLISNALKHCEPGTEIVARVEEHDDAALVSVADRGPGIAPNDLPHLFERGFRAAGARKAEGLGLGLYITRLLVEAHGGRIWVDSTVGEGATFFFTLPRA